MISLAVTLFFFPVDTLLVFPSFFLELVFCPPEQNFPYISTCNKKKLITNFKWLNLLLEFFKIRIKPRIITRLKIFLKLPRINSQYVYAFKFKHKKTKKKT